MISSKSKFMKMKKWKKRILWKNNIIINKINCNNNSRMPKNKDRNLQANIKLNSNSKLFHSNNNRFNSLNNNSKIKILKVKIKNKYKNRKPKSI